MFRIVTKISGLFGLTLLLFACGDNEPPPVEPTSRPVKTFVVAGGTGDAIRTFPGRLDAAQRAELAFRLPGQLQEILVREGDLVDKGQVLARLDPTDYRLVYQDRKASYDKAERNFKRAKDLVGDGNISRMDYDRMEASFRSAEAALSQAKQDLDYTVLHSPFSGRIAQRLVENFEDVQAKQAVFTLQNIDVLDVVIDLPESVVRMVRALTHEERSIARGPTAASTTAYATFEGRPGEKFRLQPKEIATAANEQTQTYRATFTMPSPDSFTLLPGMTTTVYLDLSRLVDEEAVRQVPVRAVQADSGLQPRVWVLDPQTMTVSSREVSVGRMTGRYVQITDGLEGGEEVVAVGAPYLAQGMKVTRMPKSEQAEPRADDPV